MRCPSGDHTGFSSVFGSEREAGIGAAAEIPDPDIAVRSGGPGDPDQRQRHTLPIRRDAYGVVWPFWRRVFRRPAVLVEPGQRQLPDLGRRGRVEQQAGIRRPECRARRAGLHDRHSLGQGDGLPRPLQPVGVERPGVQRLSLEPEQMPGTGAARRDVERLPIRVQDSRTLRWVAEQAGVDALDLRVLAGDEIQKAIAVGEELRCRVRDFAFGLPQRRHRAAGGRDRVQSARTAKQEDTVPAPGGRLVRVGPRHVRERDRRPTGEVEPLQLPLGHERDGSAVRRPHRRGGSFGAGEPLGLGALSRRNQSDGAAPDRAGAEDNRRSVGRHRAAGVHVGERGAGRRVEDEFNGARGRAQPIEAGDGREGAAIATAATAAMRSPSSSKALAAAGNGRGGRTSIARSVIRVLQQQRHPAEVAQPLPRILLQTLRQQPPHGAGAALRSGVSFTTAASTSVTLVALEQRGVR